MSADERAWNAIVFSRHLSANAVLEALAAAGLVVLDPTDPESLRAAGLRHVVTIKDDNPFGGPYVTWADGVSWDDDDDIDEGTELWRAPVHPKAEQ